jgi:hypothetical protein
VFENRVQRRIPGPRRDEIIGGWNLHNKQLHNSYSLPRIIRMVKSWRMRWLGLVAEVGKIGMHSSYWWESQKDRDHYENQHAGGCIILRQI